MTTKANNSTANNVYLSHIEQDGWNDVRAYHIANETAWRTVGLLAILALMVVAIYAMYIVNQDKHKTLIFEKDSLGNITTLGLADKSFNVDNKIIAHQLAAFVVALREVPKDTQLKRRNIDLVHKMIDPKILGQVDQLLINQYSMPAERQIIVNLSSLAPLPGGKSWSLSWVEQTINSNDIVVREQNFSSVMTFTRADTVDPAIQLVNPVGLFINYLHPVEDIHDAVK